MKSKPNLAERALNVISPAAAEKRFAQRLRRERERQGGTARTSAPKMAATGYGNYGASTTLNAVLGWQAGGGSAEDDIDLHGALLRERARDLYAGGGLARSGIVAMVTSVIGWGIQAKPKIDGAALGLSDDKCDEWEQKTLREFKLWAENAQCDAERAQDFYGLQRLAFQAMLMSGDAFALFGMKENKRTPYQTTVRILEADRISTPESTAGESEAREADQGGGRIIDGVEIDREGAVVRYWVTNRHPLTEESAEDVTWVPIDASGDETGMPQILHLMMRERPEQRRGIPFVAGQIVQIKQFDRYNTYELAANIVRSMLCIFLKSTADNGQHGLTDAVDEEEKVTDDDLHIELQPGAVFDLPSDKELVTLNPLQVNNIYGQYVETLETIIGSSMGVPKEVLIKKYDSNYTAARASLLDFWRTVRVYRTHFNSQFNQPVYEQWLSEAVAAGRIEAPGFFDDPAIRQAWCGCLWMGASMGHVDPLKEVKAAAERISHHITTEEQEASEYNGNDWNENIRQHSKELKEINEILSTLGMTGEEAQT